MRLECPRFVAGRAKSSKTCRKSRLGFHNLKILKRIKVSFILRPSGWASPRLGMGPQGLKLSCALTQLLSRPAFENHKGKPGCDFRTFQQPTGKSMFFIVRRKETPDSFRSSGESSEYPRKTKINIFQNSRSTAIPWRLTLWCCPCVWKKHFSSFWIGCVCIS